MKIKFVIPRNVDRPSGGLKVGFDYANEMSRHGHEVEILFVGDSNYKIRTHNHLKILKHFYDYAKTKGKQKKISWYQLDEKIKISSSFHFKPRKLKDDERVICLGFDIILSIADRLDNLKNYFYLIQHDEKVYYKEEIIREAWKLPMKKIVVSSWLKREVEKYSSEVYLVKNYTDESKFYLTKPVEDRKPIVSMIYHTNPYKGTATGIEALELAYKRYPKFEAQLFGVFDQPENLPAFIKYLGKRSGDQLRDEVYNESSIYLFPSVLEGWGLVATEAMACGAALVTTKNGGSDDFALDEQTALVNEVGDAAGLAESIVRILKDQDLRQKLANNALESIKNLTLENSYNNLMKVLED
ncbi:glycosyltransferase family 4 protein [Streptococcaceae bacterium ESL0729]|nr:glycosyltransferase family 4 protein [Streptococcaceae bacterium ESL0729]